MSLHPCQNCGACCAFFSVKFDVLEPVPRNLTLPAGDFSLVMRGTERPTGKRCAALSGSLGDEVACSIYSSRPSACRAFRASFEEGLREHRCDQARLAWGLPPLSPEDWSKFFEGARKKFSEERPPTETGRK